MAADLDALLEAVRGATGERLGPGAISAVADRTVRALGQHHARRRRTLAARLTNDLRRRYPERTAEQIRAAVRREVELERVFQERALERWRDGLTVALAADGRFARAAAVEAIKERELRVAAAREMAARERAVGTLEADGLRETSPRGAFWRLSGDVREHTPDCIAMAGWFWPWNVLDKLRPPVHHGCACSLHSETEALANGWIKSAADIPTPRKAMTRARRVLRRYPDVRARLTEAEVLEVVEAQVWREALHPRNRLGRFRTKAQRDLARMLDDATPRGTAAPATVSDVDVEQALATAKAARRDEIRQEVRAALAEGRVPKLEDAAGLSVLAEEGFALARGGREQVWRHPSGRTLYLTVADDGYVEWARIESSRPEARKLDRPPETWAEHGRDMAALAEALGEDWGHGTNLRSFATEDALGDTAGLRSWEGDITVGPDGEDAIELAAELRREGERLPDTLAASVYLAYQVSAHEVAHTVNPIHAQDYRNRALRSVEEALTEEVGHLLAAERLREQGQDDVLQWLSDHPHSPYARGSYQAERNGLLTILRRAGVEPDSREDFVFGLKFDVDPAERVDFLADMIQAGPDPLPTRHDALAWVEWSTVRKRPAIPTGQLTRPVLPESRKRRVRVNGTTGYVEDVLEDAVWVRTDDGDLIRARAVEVEDVPVVGVGRRVSYRGGAGTVREVLAHRHEDVIVVEPDSDPERRVVLHGVDLDEPLREAATYVETAHPRNRLGRWIDKLGTRHVIAIDGPAASGKTTVARAVAERLNARHVDTGALFRAAGLAALRGEDPVGAAERARLEGTRVLLDEEDVSEAIRTADVDMAAARLGGDARVRRAVERAVARIVSEPGLSVVDGRDAGRSLGAETRVYLDAPLPVRAARRSAERPDETAPAILDALRARDAMDEPRLAVARREGAVIDTTHADLEATVDRVIDRAARDAKMPDAPFEGIRGRLARKDPPPPPMSAEVHPESFRAIFDGFEHGGLSLEVRGSERFGGGAGARLNMDVVDMETGETAGFARYTLQNAEGFVKLDNIALTDRYRSRGFATALHDHVYEELARLGVDHMRLTAVDVGSYAWAREGYRFERPQGAGRRLLERAREDGRWGDIRARVDDETIADLVTFLERDDLEEAEIAAWGREHSWRDEDGRLWWPGKRLMVGGEWEGVRAL